MIALADKISKSFGGRVLYSNATLQLNAGERWALVGPNGAGKTTLLKIIMGLESADEGTITFAKDATLGLNSGRERLTTFQSKLPKLPKVQRSISILKTMLMLWSASSVLVAMN